jgi:hypothetical protein
MLARQVLYHWNPSISPPRILKGRKRKNALLFTCLSTRVPHIHTAISTPLPYFMCTLPHTHTHTRTHTQKCNYISTTCTSKHLGMCAHRV